LLYFRGTFLFGIPLDTGWDTNQNSLPASHDALPMLGCPLGGPKPRNEEGEIAFIMAKRSIFAVPWPVSHRTAFKACADKLKGGTAEGNAAELARTILEQFMFCVLDNDEIRKHKLLAEWDKEPPPPTILRYALDKCGKKVPVSKK
jgi:hypothetical protein